MEIKTNKRNNYRYNILLSFSFISSLLITLVFTQEIDFSIWTKVKSTEKARRIFTHEEFYVSISLIPE